MKRNVSKKAGSKSREMLLVSTKAKEALKTNGYNVSSDTLEALNEYIYLMIEQAQKRSTANGRKTIKPYDILA